MPDDAFDDDADFGDGSLGEDDFGDPLPPEDRIWRHPSEVGGLVQAARRRREISNGKLIGFAVTASLLGSVITVAALVAGGAFDRTIVERSTRSVETIAAPTTFSPSETSNWPQIVQRLAPGVARLEGAGDSATTSGSAVSYKIENDDTYFVTSRDLVTAVDRITLVLSGNRHKKAELVAVDQYTNLAVLKLPGERVPPPDFDSSTDPQPGMDAIVVGAPPQDAPSPTVAKALVGSVGNSVRHRDGTEIEALLRTDANITPDTKGGALVDQNGALVGIVVFMERDETQVERFGYALPAAAVTATADSMIHNGFPTQVWFGIGGQDLTDAVRLALPVELGVAGGAVLRNVAVESPAAQCGLMAGDVITKVNTTSVESMTRMVMTLRELEPTDTVAIEFVRGQALQSCYTTLARPPEVRPGPPDGDNTEITTGSTTVTTATAGEPATTVVGASS